MGQPVRYVERGKKDGDGRCRSIGRNASHFALLCAKSDDGLVESLLCGVYQRVYISGMEGIYTDTALYCAVLWCICWDSCDI